MDLTLRLFWCCAVARGARHLTGIEKFSAFKTIQKPFVGSEHRNGRSQRRDGLKSKQKFYIAHHIAGVPPSLKDKFATEPMLPHAMATPFYGVLG